MKRTYVSELEWALEQINSVKGDRNPNRAAQIDMAVKYGLDVAIARRSHERLPNRPDIKNAV